MALLWLDGFESYGVNRNQGAESSLAYLISHLTALQAYAEIHVSDEKSSIKTIV
ncbi:hypothetical protein LCGC14_2922070 [marine sediment metagenome]|uniref:Uncharacterized protein n=1 Tax=marine sediment metagenome TaxID=412755 RepID=A0A0F8ZW47_9ZZZZ